MASSTAYYNAFQSSEPTLHMASSAYYTGFQPSEPPLRVPQSPDYPHPSEESAYNFNSPVMESMGLPSDCPKTPEYYDCGEPVDDRPARVGVSPQSVTVGLTDDREIDDYSSDAPDFGDYIQERCTTLAADLATKEQDCRKLEQQKQALEFTLRICQPENDRLRDRNVQLERGISERDDTIASLEHDLDEATKAVESKDLLLATSEEELLSLTTRLREAEKENRRLQKLVTATSARLEFIEKPRRTPRLASPIKKKH